jgi:hypothetical protein
MSNIATLLDAVAVALSEHGPQTPEWLVSILDDMKLWRVRHPNPAAAIRRALQNDIRQYGPRSRFYLPTPNVFAIRR